MDERDNLETELTRRLNRRTFLKATFGVTGAALLAACAPAQAPSPTSAPAKPAAAQPTTAPANPAAPAPTAAAAGSSQAAAANNDQQPLAFKAGTTEPPTSPVAAGWLKYVQLIDQRTNGKVKISFFPSGQIGGELEMVQGLQMGTVGMVNTSTTGYPIYDVLWIPYIFRDMSHMWKVFRGPIGEQWSNQFIKDKGIRVMGYAYRSPRDLTTSKLKVTKVSDLKGAKIRVPESPGIVAGFKSFGANPTPMAWPEVFTALQQGTVDGQENPLETIAANKLWEVQKYVMLTQHIYIPWLELIDERIWQKMTPATQKIMVDTWNEIADEVQTTVLANDKGYQDTLAKNGMTVVAPPELDVQSFRDANKDTWKDIAPKAWGDGVWEKVQATQ